MDHEEDEESVVGLVPRLRFQHESGKALACCCFSTDGGYVMVGSDDRCVRLFNPSRPDPVTPSAPLLIKTYDGGHGYGVTDVAIASGNSRFATCGGDRAAFYWDVGSGEVVRRLKGHNEGINAVAFSDDGALLLSGSADRSVRIFDLRSQGSTPVQILDEARDAVMSIVVHGHEITVAGMDGVVRCYDARVGETYVDDVGEAMTGVSVTHDNECVLTMCLDDSVRLLDKRSGRQLNAYYGHKHSSYHMRGDLSCDDAVSLNLSLSLSLSPNLRLSRSRSRSRSPRLKPKPILEYRILKHIVMGSEDGGVYAYDFLSAVTQTLTLIQTRTLILTPIPYPNLKPKEVAKEWPNAHKGAVTAVRSSPKAPKS
mmetsp:Transcript_45063/g.141153  ORF Transcript_45063/g.141153 Transcript_45063/m.141153 type:complete len:369 (-) Transcript_45063:204-1310(-)